MKINYSLLTQQIVDKTSDKKSLLLHVCCAPCLSGCIEWLAAHFKLTLFYYNPNIIPEEEWKKRKEEIPKLLTALKLSDVEIITPPYDNDVFLALSKGRQEEPEGGSRCQDCIAMRVAKTAEFAGKNGFDYFCTTLSVSPHKNAEFINTTGYLFETNSISKWLPSDFKKKDGYKHSISLSASCDIYRQNYCGCKPR